jgi:hypothetical protein
MVHVDHVQVKHKPYVRLYDGRKAAKRIVKFLAEWKDDPVTTQRVLRRAPDSVIKGIANLALNIEQNPDIELTSSQRSLFRKHRDIISHHTSPHVSISSKRARLTTQRGGVLPFLPLLLKAGIGLLGSGILGPLFNKVFGNNEQQQ